MIELEPFFAAKYHLHLPPRPLSPFEQKTGQNNYNSVTKASNQNYETTFYSSILPTGEPDHT